MRSRKFKIYAFYFEFCHVFKAGLWSVRPEHVVGLTGIIKFVVVEGNTYVIFNTSLDEFVFIKN